MLILMAGHGSTIDVLGNGMNALLRHPDRFDVARNSNRHIAFGREPHLCLGNSLSRLDMEVMFATLFQRVRRIVPLEQETVFKRGLSVRGPVALPVRLLPW